MEDLRWPEGEPPEIDEDEEVARLCEYFGVQEKDLESYLEQFESENNVPQQYTDQEVVAGFNSCIDMVKYNNLPSYVRERFKDLMKHHRIKWGCFSNADGFGLRVFVDNDEFEITSTGDDTADLKGKPTWEQSARVDLDGKWVRCPPVLFTEKKEKKLYIISKPNGRGFYTTDSSVLDEDQEWVWYSGRIRAFTFDDKTAAEARAKEVNGIVLEKD